MPSRKRILHTRVGSRALKWVISPIDGEITRRCGEGGFIIVGKTSTSELTILPFVQHGPRTTDAKSAQ